MVICRTSKPKERRKKVLFINAVGEVTRERAQSFLTDAHIARVVAGYRDFVDVPGFARVVSLADIRAMNADAALRRPRKPGEYPQQCCLARTVAAEQRYSRSALDVQANISQSRVVAVEFRYAVDFKRECILR